MNKNLLTNPTNWLIIAFMIVLPLLACMLVKHFEINIED